MRDTSLAAFLELIASGSRHTLATEVYRAICEIGPVHNMRLLEYLQQKERVNKKPADRIKWTRSNCWPRVTGLVGMGAVIDAGSYRVVWDGKKTTLHVWYVASANTEISAGWEKVERGENTEKKIRPIPSLAAAAQVSSATQAGRVLRACRHNKTKPKSGQRTLFPIG